MKQNRSLNESGFTIVELGIAVLILSVLFAAVISMASGIFNTNASFSRRITVTQELDEILASIKKEVHLRLSTSTSIQGIISSAFSSTEVPCQGLKITQLDGESGVQKTVEYTTQCRIDTTPTQTNLKAHPELSCGASGAAEIVISRDGILEKSYPRLPGHLSTAVCFRVQGNSIDVEIGGKYRDKKGSKNVFKKTRISTLDHSEGIQFLSP